MDPVKDEGYGDHCGSKEIHKPHTWNDKNGVDVWLCMGTYPTDGIQLIWYVDEKGVPQPVRKHGERAVLEVTQEHLAWIQVMIDTWYPDANYFIAGIQPI